MRLRLHNEVCSALCVHHLHAAPQELLLEEKARSSGSFSPGSKC